jgi:hypothetical protein
VVLQHSSCRSSATGSNGPVTDVTSEAFRCYEVDYNATPGETQTATVSAGSSLTFTGGFPVTFIIPA